MSNNYISVGVFKEFWKTKRYKKVKKYNSRKEVEEKVKEIALTYHDEITPLESDGSKDYRPEIEFLDYCHSGTPSGWNLAFTGMALLNFSDSVIETFNIQDEEVGKLVRRYLIQQGNAIALLEAEYHFVEEGDCSALKDIAGRIPLYPLIDSFLRKHRTL